MKLVERFVNGQTAIGVMPTKNDKYVFALSKFYKKGDKWVNGTWFTLNDLYALRDSIDKAIEKYK